MKAWSHLLSASLLFFVMLPFDEGEKVAYSCLYESEMNENTSCYHIVPFICFKLEFIKSTNCGLKSNLSLVSFLRATRLQLLVRSNLCALKQQKSHFWRLLWDKPIPVFRKLSPVEQQVCPERICATLQIKKTVSFDTHGIGNDQKGVIDKK